MWPNLQEQLIRGGAGAILLPNLLQIDIVLEINESIVLSELSQYYLLNGKRWTLLKLKMFNFPFLISTQCSQLSNIKDGMLRPFFNENKQIETSRKALKNHRAMQTYLDNHQL